MLVVLLAALPFVGGKLFDWQTMLVTLLVFVAAILFLIGQAGKPGAARAGVIDYALIGILVLALVSATGTVYLHASLVALGQLYSYLMIFWLARGLLSTAYWRRVSVAAILLGGTLAAVWGLNEYTRTVVTSGHVTWRIYGPFFNPNLLAGYLLLALPLAVAIVWWARWDTQSEGHPQIGLAAGFAALLMAAALLLTGSKGGIIAAAAVVMVLAFTLPRPGTSLARRTRWLAIGCILAGLLVPLVVPTIRVRIFSAFTTQRRSAAFRYYTWIGTGAMIKERPLLGFGPGSYPYAHPQFAIAGFTRTAHQTFLQIAAETGLPSLAVLLLALVVIVVSLGGQLRRAPPEEHALAAAALAALVGFWVHNLVDYSWYVPAVGATMWALTGMMIAGQQSPPQGSVSSARLSVARVAGVVVLVVGVCLLAVGLRSQVLLQRARVLNRQGIPTAAVAQVGRAIALAPLNAELYEALADFRAGLGLSDDSSVLGQAIQAQKRAIVLAPTKPSLHRQLAHFYAQQDNLPAAVAAAQQAVAVYPNYDKGWITLARLQELNGDVEMALASYRQVSEMYFMPVRKYAAIEEMAEPGYAYAWHAVGLHALAQGKITEASFALGLAAKVLKTYFEQVPLRREILKLFGEWDESQHQDLRLMAAATTERLVSLGRPLGLMRAGELYMALDEPEGARPVLADLCDSLLPDRSLAPLEQLIVGRSCIDLAAVLAAAGEPADAERARKHGVWLLDLGLSRVDSQMVPPDWEEDDTYVVRHILRHGAAPPVSESISLVTGGRR